MKSGSNAWIVALASAVVAAGCNMVGGRGWIPQAPGEVRRYLSGEPR